MKLWYTAKEAALELGYDTPQMIYKLIDCGELPATQPKGTSRIRIKGEWLESFIRDHTKNSHLLPKIK
jgi:excisionase family DNA binding protein